MNVNTKLSRALWFLLIVCGIFMICSMQVDALGEDTTGKTEEYTVIEWRKNKADSDNDPSTTYIEKHYYNKDILCSSSTRSSVDVSDTMDKDALTADDMKCNMKDSSIHKYVVWKMLEGAQPFVSSGDVNSAHSSFSQMTYLFTVSGRWEPGWKEYTGQDIRDDKGKLCWRNASGNVVYSACDGCKQGDGSIDQWDSTNEGYTNRSMKYVMVYLHRMSRGFDLYEDFRTLESYYQYFILCYYRDSK